MLFSKNLRKLALGLIVATAASMGLVAPANADVIYDIDSRTMVNPAGSLNNSNLPDVWVSDTIGNPVSVDLSGSQVGLLDTPGSLTFFSAPSGPSTAGPSLPLSVGTFLLTNAYNGGGATIFTGVATTGTLMVTSPSSVNFAGTGVATIAGYGVKGFNFSIDFTGVNKTLTVGGTDFIPSAFTAFALSGTITTVPEPSSLALLALGGLGLGVRAYRRRQAIVA